MTHDIHWITRTLLIALAYLTAIAMTRRGIAWRRLSRGVVAVAEGRYWLLCLFFGSFFLSTLGSLLWFPKPMFHDEFCFLFMGKTFAAGRLTNEMHPLWAFFEAIHMISFPTYQAKYPPLQGLALATGIRLGHPILGVWLSSGAATVGCAWALSKFLPRVPSLVAAMAAAISFFFTGYWAQSYWGGSIAFLGGALLVGGAKSVVDRPSARGFFTLILGASVLANTRPYEGLVLVALTTLVVIATTYRRNMTRQLFELRTTAAGGALAVATVAFMAYYNYRVTGDVFVFPYELHERQYAEYPVTLLQGPLGQKTFAKNMSTIIHHRDLAPLRGYLLYQEGNVVVVDDVVGKLKTLGLFYGGPALLLGGFIALILSRRKNVAALVALLGIALSAFVALSGVYFFPHYSAPFAFFYVLLLGTIVHEIHQGRMASLGISPPNAVLSILAVHLAFSLEFDALNHWRLSTPFDRLWAEQRAELLEHLESKPGKHLVVVKSNGLATPHRDFVYNEPNVDGAKVVWSRDRERENEQLIAFYPDRQVWYLRESTPNVYILARIPNPILDPTSDVDGNYVAPSVRRFEIEQQKRRKLHPTSPFRTLW